MCNWLRVFFFYFSFYFEEGIFIILLWRSKYVVCFSFKNSMLRNTGFAVSLGCFLIGFQVIYRVKFTHTHTHTHPPHPPKESPNCESCKGQVNESHQPSPPALPSLSSPFCPQICGRLRGCSKPFFGATRTI